MSASADTQSKIVSIGDLIVLNNEPRITDEHLAKALGFARPRKIRDLIKQRVDEIEELGALHRGAKESVSGRGRKVQVEQFLLNEHQALLVTMISDTPKAREVRKALIKSFVAWRRGHQPVAVSRGERQRQNRIRFWKMQVAQAVMALDELGIDATTFDMGAVLSYGRLMSGRADKPATPIAA